MDLLIEPNQAVMVVTGLREIVQDWVGPERDAAEAHDVLEARFRERNLVEVDGKRVAPRLQGLRIPKSELGTAMVEYLEMTFAYPTPGGGKPKRVSVVWDDFEGAMWQGELIVPGLAKDPPQIDLLGVRPDEPAFVWHARQVAAVAKPKRSERPPVRSPLTSMALLGAALVVALACDDRRVAVAALGCFALAAYVARPISIEVPSKERALELFAELHQNIYRAFDARSEDEIYDLLSESVAADQLDKMYGDVFESLVLRETGSGAVAAIESVEVIARDVEFPKQETERPQFFVDWKWNVHCSVSHWGHTHRRRNEYDARYTVEHDGASWKIAAIKINDYKPIDLEDDSD